MRHRSPTKISSRCDTTLENNRCLWRINSANVRYGSARYGTIQGRHGTVRYSEKKSGRGARTPLTHSRAGQRRSVRLGGGKQATEGGGDGHQREKLLLIPCKCKCVTKNRMITHRQIVKSSPGLRSASGINLDILLQKTTLLYFQVLQRIRCASGSSKDVGTVTSGSRCGGPTTPDIAAAPDTSSNACCF